MFLFFVCLFVLVGFFFFKQYDFSVHDLRSHNLLLSLNLLPLLQFTLRASFTLPKWLATLTDVNINANINASISCVLPKHQTWVVSINL